MDPADRAAEIEERNSVRSAGTNPAAVVKRPPDAPPVPCIECGIAIPEERLAAVPDADRCVDCQELKEHMERRRA